MPRGVSRYDEARLQQRLWNPSVLLADVSNSPIWFDAADISTLTVTSSNIVTGWQNKITTSLNRNLTNPGLLSVTLPSRLINGNQVVSVDAAASMTMAQSFNCAAATFVMALARMGSGNITPLIESSSSYAYLHYANNWYWGNSVIQQSLVSEQFYLVSAVSGERYFNGQSRGGVIDTGSAVTGFRTIGSGFSSVAMQVGELTIIPRLLASSERQLLEGYLAWKWGITLDAAHPFANRPPLLGD